MDVLQRYLENEKALLLYATIFAAIAFLAGFILLFTSQKKAFCITLAVLGLLEIAAFFSMRNARNKSLAELPTRWKTEQASLVKEQQAFATKTLGSFKRLKILYAALILIGAIASSFFKLSPIANQLIFAFIIHLSAAITIDNFAEDYTKAYEIDIHQITV